MRISIGLLFVVFLVGCDFIGGGETVVSGEGNIVVTDNVVDRVAAQLAEFPTTATVTDEDLQTIYASVRRSALDGDLKASLVMLKIAAIQRTPEDEE
jgi:hypothetical protein